MPPYQSGGDMIENVAWSGTTFRPSPERFEAGTPNIAGAIGFGAAIDYMMSIDREGAHAHERKLLDRMTARLSEIGGVRKRGGQSSSGVVRLHWNPPERHFRNARRLWNRD